MGLKKSVKSIIAALILGAFISTSAHAVVVFAPVIIVFQGIAVVVAAAHSSKNPETRPYNLNSKGYTVQRNIKDLLYWESKGNYDKRIKKYEAKGKKYDLGDIYLGQARAAKTLHIYRDFLQKKLVPSDMTQDQFDAKYGSKDDVNLESVGDLVLDEIKAYREARRRS
jgi:hypothetical protein